MPYRELYELVLAAGYAVTGQDPLASFLTKLRDSPAIVSTDARATTSFRTNLPNFVPKATRQR